MPHGVSLTKGVLRAGVVPPRMKKGPEVVHAVLVSARSRATMRGLGADKISAILKKRSEPSRRVTVPPRVGARICSPSFVEVPSRFEQHAQVAGSVRIAAIVGPAVRRFRPRQVSLVLEQHAEIARSFNAPGGVGAAVGL